MPYEITDKYIIEEYLNNWFTYEELAQYLCVSLDRVISVLENKDLVTNLYDLKKYENILTHKRNINNYYINKENKKELSDIDRKVLEISKHIIENKSSIRKTAIIFNLGKTTIYDYINEKLPNISITLYKQVFDILMENKSFDTNNKNITNQVLLCYKLLKEGFSSVEIQNKLGISRNVLQRNLTYRLRKIDEEKYLEVQSILVANQIMPLQEHSFKSNK